MNFKRWMTTISLLLPFSAFAMSLPEAYQQALQNDPGLQAQNYLLEAEKHREDQAFAGFLPQVSASYSHQKSNYTAPYLNDYRDETSYYAQAQLQQMLWNQSTYERFQQAKVSSKLAQNTYTKARRDLALAVSEAYFMAAYYKKSVALAIQQIESNQFHVNSIAEKLKKGLMNKMDLLEAESKLQQSIAQKTQSKGALDVQLLKLSRLIGKTVSPSDVEVSILIKTPKYSNTGLAEFEQKARSSNLDVSEIRLNQNYYEKQLDMDLAQHYPTLDLTLSYSDSDSTSNTTYQDYSRVSVNLNVPIYSGGGVSARVSETRSRLKAVEFETQRIENDVLSEVRELYTQMRSQYESLTAIETSHQAAENYYESARAGFKLGLRSLGDLLLAEADMFRLEDQLMSIRRDIALTEFRLTMTTQANPDLGFELFK